MNFLFCSSSLNPSQPCPSFQEEFVACSKHNKTFLLNEEAFHNEEFEKALEKLPLLANKEEIIYRGWVRTKEQYEKLFKALSNKGFVLINTPEQYTGALYISNWYQHIAEYTPLTFIYPHSQIQFNVLHQNLKIFDGSALIIKDYVSSRKQDWHDACFIYSSADQQEVERVVCNFLRIQHNYSNLVGGVVFRKFVDLQKIGTHPKSKMPISQEFRSFVYKGKIIGTFPYWDIGNYNNSIPSNEWLQNLAAKIYTSINSNFFTVDTAIQENEKPICIEVGDGQVSGLSDKVDKNSFYGNFT